MRKKLIEAIFDFASDEIETIEDAKNFAMMSDEELVNVLVGILAYYKNKE
jgi:hypothetical protein